MTARLREFCGLLEPVIIAAADAPESRYGTVNGGGAQDAGTSVDASLAAPMSSWISTTAIVPTGLSKNSMSCISGGNECARDPSGTDVGLTQEWFL